MINLEVSESFFNPIYLKRMIYNQKRYQHYFGGSSSGKSYSLAQRCVLDVMDGRNYLIVRNTAATIKKSVFNEITKSISAFKINDYFTINKSDMIVTCKLSGSQIMFTGLDDVEKVKSITPVKGVITDIWVEEATECQYKDIKQLDKRLRGKSKFKKRMTFSYNPVLKTSWLYTEYFNGLWQDDKQYAESEDVSILKTTYKDNHFLADDDIKAMENESDPYYYNVYTLGNWGVLGAVIFKNYEVRDFDTEQFGIYNNGCDWGFSDDPFAFVRVAYERNIIYICKEILGVGLSNEESGNLVKPIIDKEIITCDSAEPKSINDYLKMRINAKGAKKGPGSIEHGIKWLQSKKIIVHPECKGMLEELSKYKFKEDKNGDVLPIPVDKDNHLIDALRYALEDVMSDKKVRTRKGLY